jgi:hypothetical protein
MLDFPILTFWSEDDLFKLQVKMVSAFLKCDSTHSVEASIEFARYLNFKGLDSDNYPLFLEILRNENGFAVEALIGREKAFDLFTKVQPSPYIVDFCFTVLRSYSAGGVHDLTLELIFGILYRCYHSAKEGYQLHRLSIEDVNAVGKFLDKSKDQKDPINRFILDILADIAEYRSINKEDPEVDAVSTHATAIRNAFFDKKRTMGSIMPKEILVRADYQKTVVKPRKLKKFEEPKKTAK